MVSTDKLILLFRRCVVPSSSVSGSPKVCSFFSVLSLMLFIMILCCQLQKRRGLVFFEKNCFIGDLCQEYFPRQHHHLLENIGLWSVILYYKCRYFMGHHGLLSIHISDKSVLSKVSWNFRRLRYVLPVLLPLILVNLQMQGEVTVLNPGYGWFPCQYRSV